MGRADSDKFRNEIDLVFLTKMIEYTLNGLMTEHFLNGSFQPEIYYREVKQYLEMLKKISYKS